MKRLICYEFKKLWGKPAILAVMSLIIYSTIMTGIYYIYYENVVITNTGEKISGVSAHWTVKEQSKSLEGLIDQNYLDNIVNDFNSSIEKNNFSDRLGMDMTRFQIASYLLNFPNDVEKTSNYSMNFDYDYLKSEDDFYLKYKEAVKELIRENNKYSWFPYTDEQLNQIDKKVDGLSNPFKVAYGAGLEKIIIDYSKQFWLVLIVLAFTLSTLFSKNSNNGIDELSLSSAYGRKTNMNAKVISGNLFAITVYFIFITTLLILNGAFASLHGLGQSAQAFWYTCLYDISVGIGMMMMFGMGLIGILIFSNFIMLISIHVKYGGISALLSVASVWGLLELTKTTNSLQLQLNPLYFATRLGVPTSRIADFNPYFFIGDIMIPYSLAFIGISILYLTIIRILTVYSYRKYALRG